MPATIITCSTTSTMSFFLSMHIVRTLRARENQQKQKSYGQVKRKITLCIHSHPATHRRPDGVSSVVNFCVFEQKCTTLLSAYALEYEFNYYDCYCSGGWFLNAPSGHSLECNISMNQDTEQLDMDTLFSGTVSLPKIYVNCCSNIYIISSRSSNSTKSQSCSLNHLLEQARAEYNNTPYHHRLVAIINIIIGIAACVEVVFSFGSDFNDPASLFRNHSYLPATHGRLLAPNRLLCECVRALERYSSISEIAAYSKPPNNGVYSA